MKTLTQKFNKASASAIAGALVTLIGAIVTMAPALQGAVQTILTTALVYFIANKES